MGINSNLWAAVAADGTYNFSGFGGSGGQTLTHTHFKLTGTENGAPDNLTISGSLVYATVGGVPGAACVYKLSADGTNTGSFVLTDISANDFDTTVSNNNVYLVGNKLGGGTVQSVNTLSGIASNGVKDLYTGGTLNLANFSGVQVTSVELRWTGFCANADFNSFTIASAQAPATDPTLTSTTYNASTGALVLTGTDFQAKTGATNDIDASMFTFTGEGGATYTLTDTSDVEITNATSATLSLSATDKAAVNQIINKNGTTSTSATTYNIATADDWMAGYTINNTADATNAVTVSNVAVPILTSSVYNANTGALSLTGTGFLKKTGATNDIVANKFTLTGEGGTTYTLTDTSNVEINSGSTATLSLSATDKAAVNQIINKNGTASTSATTYNLNAAEDWAAGADAAVNVVDATGNGITAANVAIPTITSSTYNASTGALVLTGTGLLKKSGATNDITANKFTFTGEGGATYTLTDTSNVEITSGTAATLTLSATDKAGVNQIINKNGTTSTSATTYNLNAAEDWAAGADAAVNVVDVTGNAITASNVAAPTITSSTYNASTGVLAVTGTGMLKLSGATNDIDVTKLTLTGEGGATRVLTTSNVEITSGTAFSVTLNAADKAAVNQIINKNGTASTSSTTYNLAAAEDWAKGADAAVNVVDATGNGITVSNVPVPAITSSTYNYATGVLAVTGTNLTKFSGATNDIDISKLTFTGEAGATYTLTSATDVEITSGTAFSVTLSAADKIGVNTILNKDGLSSASTTTYNLNAAEDWAKGADAAVNVVDATGNGITVSNYATPVVTSATYDVSNGQLVITGTNFVTKSGANNDVDASLFSITGEGGSYTLTDTADVEITSATSATVTLSVTDKLNVHGVLNKNGTQSGSATTYNLAAADNWMTGAPAVTDIADTTGNGITVSNVTTPTIVSAVYDSDTGVLVVTGTNLFKKIGASNDIDISTLTFTGEGGTYTLTSTSDVEITSATSFSVTLTGADKTGVDSKLDQIGTTSSGATTYNLAAAEDWLTGADAAANIADNTGNGITVSINPKVTSATYNATTGVLVVTGTNIQAKTGVTNDITANTFTITGEGGATYTLTNTADVERTSTTQFTLTLSATDKAGVNQIVNKNGTVSTNAATYNLAAADNWCANVTAGDTSDATNAITASGVVAPAITSATYNANTGVLVATGTGFVKFNGAANDVDASLLSITAEGSTYSLTDTSDVELTSSTSFSVTLSATDKAEVNQIVNKNGTSSTDTIAYNLEAAEDWAKGADAAVNVADATSAITASNVAVPTITSATYNGFTGTLVVTGTGFFKASGVTNDIDISTLTLKGQAGGTHTIISASDVEISSATAFTVVLSGADLTAVNALLNKNGLSAVDATVYNLAGAEDWAKGADAAVNVADLTSNGVTATINNAPVIANLNADAVNFLTGGSAVVLDNASDATITDADSANFSGGTVTVSITANAQAAEDVVSVGSVGTISTAGSNVVHTDAGGTTIGTFAGGTGGANLVVTLNANATPARVQDLLRALKYSNTDAATLNLAARTVRVTVNDGDGGNATSANQDITVNLIRVPNIDLDGDNSSGATGLNFNGSFTQGSGAVATADVDANITDDGTFKTLSIHLNNRPDGTVESLSSTFGTGAQVINTENVTIGTYDNTSGDLNITIDDSSSTAATMILLIESIRYNNTSTNPNTTSRSIVYKAVDNADNLGNPATATISVTAVNNDVDGDGYLSTVNDCNDNNAAIHPGAVDIANNGIDEDCSGADLVNTTLLDNDGDGFTPAAGDCNDAAVSIYPGATEIANNGIDEDCSGADLVNTTLLDNDGDGFTPAAGDCNDAAVSIYPGATEIANNGIDEDCSGTDLVTTTPVDNDGDGFTLAAGDCNDAAVSIYPGATEIANNGIDEDCSGADLVDTSLLDNDNDGYSPATGDCNDAVATIYPGAFEIANNNIDEDCSGADFIVHSNDNDNIEVKTVSDPATKTTTSTISENGVDVKAEQSDKGTLQHALVVGGVATLATSDVAGSSITVFRDANGGLGVKTNAVVVNENNENVEIEVIANADGSSTHSMNIAGVNSTLFSKVPGAQTNINSDGSLSLSLSNNSAECNEHYSQIDVVVTNTGESVSTLSTYTCEGVFIAQKKTLLDSKAFAHGSQIEIKKNASLEYVVEITMPLRENLRF